MSNIPHSLVAQFSPCSSSQNTRNDKQCAIPSYCPHFTHAYNHCSRYEAYDRVEGQAQIAERTAQIANKDDLSKSDRKELEREKTHQLQMRHRGVMQYQAARTAKWSKEGLKRRVGALKDKITGNGDKDRSQVDSEA